MEAKPSGEWISRVGMILPSDGQGKYSLLLTVPGDADYRLIDHSTQSLREWVYERVYVAGWLSDDEGPVLTVERLEVLNDSGDDEYWEDDDY